MKFRVLTYNIHRAIGIDRRFRPERILGILNHHDADLVLLQEVDVGVPRSGMLDLAREMASGAGYPYYATGLNVVLREGHYGNATLSRHPITHYRNIDLTVGDKKKRGCLHTTVNFGDALNPVIIEAFNLHLGLSPQERVRQVGTLIHSAEFTSLDKSCPCLIAGDFNDWGTLLAPIFTDILDFECASNHSRGYHNSYNTYPSFSPTGGLDKIFYRGPLTLLNRRRCWSRVVRIASDHLPVIADFEID